MGHDDSVGEYGANVLTGAAAREREDAWASFAEGVENRGGQSDSPGSIRHRDLLAAPSSTTPAVRPST